MSVKTPLVALAIAACWAPAVAQAQDGEWADRPNSYRFLIALQSKDWDGARSLLAGPIPYYGRPNDVPIQPEILISKLKNCELDSMIGLGSPAPGLPLFWKCTPGPSFSFVLFESPEGVSAKFYSEPAS